VLVTGLLLGALAGFVLRRRLAVVLVLVAHVAALELVRLPVAGPTVDGIHLDTLYGIVACVTGRGFHGQLSVVPAVVGVVYGAGLCPPVDRAPLGGGRGAAFVAQPGTTAPIRTPDGTPLAGSIAELGTARVAVTTSACCCAAAVPRATVLHYLAAPVVPTWARRAYSASRWNATSSFATWDQRGTATSYGALDPPRR